MGPKGNFLVLNVVFENTAKILNQFSKFMTWKTCNPETEILYQTGSFNKFKEICLLNHFKSKLKLNFIWNSFVIWFFGGFKKKNPSIFLNGPGPVRTQNQDSTARSGTNLYWSRGPWYKTITWKDTLSHHRLSNLKYKW